MRITHRLLALVLFASEIVVSPLPTLAIPPADPWSGATLEEALKTSVDKHRILLVFFYDPFEKTSRRMLDETFTNHTLAAWITWHAEAVKMDTRSASARSLMSTLGVKASYIPATCVFVRGKLLRIYVHSGGLFRKTPWGPDPHPRINDFDLIRAGPVRSSGLIMTLDDMREAVELRDAGWGVTHERQNPAPEAPRIPDPRFSDDDGLGAVVSDLKDGPGGIPDVLARLDEARAAVKSGDLFAATGLYTWLWERSAQVDPTMDALRQTTVAAEMADLAKRRAGSRERFAKIRDAGATRLLWADYPEMDEWFLLNGVVGDDGETLEYLDQFVNDLDEGTMAPRTDLLAYKAMLVRPSVDAPAKSVKFGEEFAALRHQRDGLSAPGPKSATAENLKQLRLLRERIILTEAARLYALSLTSGDEAHAAEAVKIALSVSDTPATRCALIAVALAAGQPRDVHAAWLAEARAAGKPHEPLERQLKQAQLGRQTP